MFSTNSNILKMFNSRISGRSCRKCKTKTMHLTFQCKRCGSWYCFVCGFELRKCPECRGKLG